MRLEKFESVDVKSIGEGDEKKVFVNPGDERKIIAERKDETERDTPRQLKGRYYLTKIAHLLLPKNIPDIYQASESSAGKQTVDTERIFHTKGHRLLQEARRSGGGEESAKEKIIEEMGEKIGELDLELERIGLGFNVDPNVGNYTKDEKENVYYLETFKPWQPDIVDKKELEILFDEKEMENAIKNEPNQKIREECEGYLNRLLVLFEEEKQELQKKAIEKETKSNSSPLIKDLEAMFEIFLKEELLKNLNAIKTEEEALNSKERDFAKQGLTGMISKLKILGKGTDITNEEYSRMQDNYKILANAVGTINRGMVDHDR